MAEITDYEQYVIDTPDRRLVYVARVQPITNNDTILLTDDVLIGTDSGSSTGVSAALFSVGAINRFYNTRDYSYVQGSNFYTRSNPRRVKLGPNAGKNVIVVSVGRRR